VLFDTFVVFLFFLPGSSIACFSWGLPAGIVCNHAARGNEVFVCVRILIHTNIFMYVYVHICACFFGASLLAWFAMTQLAGIRYLCIFIFSNVKVYLNIYTYTYVHVLLGSPCYHHLQSRKSGVRYSCK